MVPLRTVFSCGSGDRVFQCTRACCGSHSTEDVHHRVKHYTPPLWCISKCSTTGPTTALILSYHLDPVREHRTMQSACCQAWVSDTPHTILVFYNGVLSRCNPHEVCMVSARDRTSPSGLKIHNFREGIPGTKKCKKNVSNKMTFRKKKNLLRKVSVAEPKHKNLLGNLLRKFSFSLVFRKLN